MRIGVAGPADLGLLAGSVVGPKPTTRGYAAAVVSVIALGLHERGHAIEVFTLSPDARDIATYEGERLRVHVGPFRSGGKGRDALRVERQVLIEQMRANPVDIVHAHWTYEFALAALNVAPDRTVVTVRDWWPAILRHHPHPYRVVRAGMQDRVLRRAPVLVANSAYTAEKIHRWYRREAPIIPNPMIFPDEVPEREHSDSSSPIVGSVNNGFGRRKNVQTLIDSWALVTARFPDATLRLVGAGYELGGEGHRYALRTVGDRGIEFLGPLSYERVLAQMRDFDLLVHPSREESFGSTLLEAISQGTPVVAGARSGAVPWVLDHGRCGRLVDVRDPGALAAEILAALELGPADRAAIIEEAFQVARSRFSLDAVLDLHESVYEGVLLGGCGIR